MVTSGPRQRQCGVKHGTRARTFVSMMSSSQLIIIPTFFKILPVYKRKHERAKSKQARLEETARKKNGKKIGGHSEQQQQEHR